MTFTVAGGFYYERCYTPPVEELYGSGGRAAAALATFTKVHLHTFFPTEHAGDVISNMDAIGVSTTVHPSSSVVEFFYHFPLSPPRITPIPLPFAAPVEVSAERILRFGCVEGELITHGAQVVFDPQSGGRPRPFSSNGSSAERLALVLNEAELFTLSPAGDIDSAVAALPDMPEVAVIKSGPHGAFVFEHGKRIGKVHPYKSESIYKIGSGDIFSAMFAHGWAELGMQPIEAADRASKYVSVYVELRQPFLPETLPDRTPWEPKLPAKRVYLAGSFFNTEHRWLIEEARAALISIGIPVFSPLHDVGLSLSPSVAEDDLKGLEDCDVILALLSDMDPGTLFEVGHAVANNKKVIVLAENAGPHDLTMIIGTKCSVFSDLSTAIHQAAWEAMA